MKQWKILPLLLAILLVLSGCATTTEPADGSDSVSESEAPSVPVTDLSGYKLVYALNDGSEVITRVNTLAKELQTATGTKLEIIPDSVKGSDNYLSKDAEILIGQANREASATILEDFTHNYSYVVRQVGNKIVVMGASREATLKAVDVFLDMVKETGKLAIEENCNVQADYLLERFPAGSAMHTVVNEYSIIYANDGFSYADSVGKELAQTLTGCSEKTLRANDVLKKETDKEILIGNTNRAASKAAMTDIDYYDYRLAISGSKIVVAGGSEVALNWAMDLLVEKLMDGTLDLSKNSEVFYDFDATINPIAKDFSTFTPSWYGTVYTTPSWLRADLNGWDEKAYALSAPTNKSYRITGQVHRGDVVYYPEGSLESIASCIWAGMDVMEMDIHLTKDGVAILHHDDTLSRMTNATEFAGKPGYPVGLKISDWTYEQIRSLSMKDQLGGDTKVTSYKVPTLYEGLLVCADRIFIQIDDKESAITSKKFGFYPVANATGSEACFYTHFDGSGRGPSDSHEAKSLDTLNKWLGYDKNDTKLSAFIQKATAWTAQKGFALRGEPYWPNPTDKYTAWSGHEYQVERESTWVTMLDKGYYHFWTESPVALSKYISRTCTATTPT